MESSSPQSLTDFFRLGNKAIKGACAWCWHCLFLQQVPNVTLTRRTTNGALIRSLLFACVAVAGFIYLAYTLHKIQIVKHSHFDQEVHKLIKTSSPTIGQRGLFFDCNGNLLVATIPGRTIIFEPKLIPGRTPEELAKKRTEVIDILSTTLNLDKDTLTRQCDEIFNGPVSVRIKCKLSVDNATLIDHWKLTGVTIVPPNTESEQYQLYISPRACTPKELENMLAQLSPLTSLSVKELKNQIQKKLDRPKQLTLARNIDEKKVASLCKQLNNIGLKTYKTSKGYPCVQARPDEKRCYVQGPMLSSLIGLQDITDKGIKGTSGLEELFDEVLKPTDGKVVYEIGGGGQYLHNSKTTEIPSHNGANIYLTISSHIQMIADTALSRAVEQYNPERAYAIMMNPKTGAIMALAQYPSYDPDNRERIIDPSGFQLHSLFETYEPGSIMKSIPIAYALDKGIVNLDTIIFCENRRWVYMGSPLNDTHTLGDTSVSDILMYSSNIGSAKIGLEMGSETLYKAFTDFGFGQPTRVGFLPENCPPICFGGESRGRLRALEKWDSLSPTRFPIGQGISCTPFQMLQAYGALANHGTMMHPYIIDKIVFNDGAVLRSEPRIKGIPISPHGAAKITQALKTVVSPKGTGKNAALERYQVAGKTGTGQIWLTDRHQYAAHLFTGSFVGYVPADNPEFVLLVSLRHINVHGGTACCPVFKEIAEKTLDYLGTKPDISKTDTNENKTENKQAFRP